MKSLSSAPVTRRRALSIGLGLVASAEVPAFSWARTATKGATFVLVHGAWHGGWCWRRVADRLAAKGHYVVAPTLSGVGERSHLPPESINLTTQIDDVVGEIRWKDLDGIVLVGHSYGGMVITGVAERLRDRIAAIVYLDAFLPEDGQSLYDLTHTTASPGAAVKPRPPAYFHVNDADSAWVESKLTPHPLQCFTEKLKVTGAYQTVPRKLYVRAPLFKIAAFDNALERCRADRSWKTESVTCGHDVMIDQPSELTSILERFI
ncbi:MAG TPA: alpha/beta hydrolase [Terracidiphilus sp.]|nr:alpha/beta hydrolase [Terracidiphilus sp.]